MEKEMLNQVETDLYMGACRDACGVIRGLR